MDIVAAYEQVGTFRGAAALCGTTHKTVRRVIEAHEAGRPPDAPRQRDRVRNTDRVVDVIAEKVKATDGRITAKRLLPIARAAGYAGSARNSRRAVADAKARWRRQRRVFRPWVPAPGEHLVIDWITEGGWQVFCAVMAWSRWRFVRIAKDQRAATTMRLLAECFEMMGGTPKVVLTDRMGCLKRRRGRQRDVPTPEFVRFATHYGFRPDFCEAADPGSKGMVESLARYAQEDLIVPAGAWATEAEANEACVEWCEEVNGAVHSTIAAVPAKRLVEEAKVLRPLPSLRPPLRRGERRRVDKLATVRIGSARYSVPVELVGSDVLVIAAEGEIVVEHHGNLVARHALVAPGEVSIVDEHYGGPRREPSRAVSAKRDVKVLVVGNPANTNALIAMSNAKDLDPSRFTAMTRLDHNRAIAQLAAKADVHGNAVTKMTIWGNHSATQYPDVFHAEVDGAPAFEKVGGDQAWLEGEFIPTVQQRGAAIIKARGLSSAASAANAAVDHIRSWSLGTPEGDWVSMGVPSDGSYGVPEGIISSFPVTCSGGRYEIVQGLDIDDFSRPKIDASAQELVDERDAVKDLGLI